MRISGTDIVTGWYGGADYRGATPVTVGDGTDAAGIVVVATSTIPAPAAEVPTSPPSPAVASAPEPTAPQPEPVTTLALPAAPGLTVALGARALPASPPVRVRVSQRVTLTATPAAGTEATRIEFSDSAGVLGATDVVAGQAVLVTRLRGGRQSVQARVIAPVTGPASAPKIIRVIDTAKPKVALSWAGATGRRNSVVRVRARDAGGVANVKVRARSGGRWGPWTRLLTDTWGAPGWPGSGCVAAKATDWAGNVSRTTTGCT
jgi:hypothetical protein